MSKWQNMYQEKLVSAQAAANTIESGDHIWFPVGVGEPHAFLRALVDRKETLQDVTINQILPVRSWYYDQEMVPHIKHNSWFTSGASRKAVQGGWADFIPNYFHEIPKLLRCYWPSDAVGVVVSPMDEHGYFSMSLGTDYVFEALKKARKVIFEVNPMAPRCFGRCQIHVSQVTHVVECNEPLPDLPIPALTDEDRTIGGYVAELIEDGSTIQVGYGGVPNAVCQALKGKRDLGIHTEMVTEGLMELVQCGAANNSKKTLNPGKLIGTFAWGTSQLYKFMNNNPMIEMHPVDYTNDPYIIGQHDKMIAINATIEVDLLGQCCSESMGSNQWSGTGGQADFFKGANRSNGGMGFVTTPSTAKGGTLSRIVPTLQPGAVVTTSKNDVDHVVTEFGVAKLRGKTARERALALIRVAHPDFREELTAAAQRMNRI